MNICGYYEDTGSKFVVYLCEVCMRIKKVEVLDENK